MRIWHYHKDENESYPCERKIGSGETKEWETWTCKQCGTQMTKTVDTKIRGATLAGYDFELIETPYLLTKRGWRIAHTHGPFDLWAIKAGKVLLIQCKLSKHFLRKKFSPKLKRELLEEAKYLGIGIPCIMTRKIEKDTELTILYNITNDKEHVIAKKRMH